MTPWLRWPLWRPLTVAHNGRMDLQFRKCIRLLPGLWLNVSKTGVSTSVGGDGVTVNLRDGK